MTTSLGENKSELAASPSQDYIAECVRRHWASRHQPEPFVPGRTRIPLNVPTYGSEEVIEAMDSLLSTWVTMGKKVKRFEEMFAEYIGAKHAVMVNSGSSANLLALKALDLPEGSEVITPALTWATTVFPIAQAGLVPVLVDVDLATYNVSPKAIQSAITPKTVAIMPVHLLGNPCKMEQIMFLAKKHNLYVIEDSCEAHGAEQDPWKVGSIGDLSTFSFFFSHHISTIEGGMVLTNNSLWADECRSMRAHGWVRDLPYRHVIEKDNPSIDPRFLFTFPGYNFRPTEIGGAFGIHQLPRLEGFIQHRRDLAAYFNRKLAKYSDFLQLPVEAPNTRHSYFSYPVTVKEGAPFTKKELQAHLEWCGLETRQIEAGCMSLQPAMKNVNYRVAGPLTNAEYIHENGFFFGLHTGMTPEIAEAIVGYFEQFIQSKLEKAVY